MARLFKYWPLFAVPVILFLFFFLDARKGGFPPCPFHLLTGMHCPGCGSQRALSALLHGDFLQAFRYNMLFVLILPLLVAGAVANLWSLIKQRSFQPALFYSNKLVYCILFLTLIFWILRNVNGMEMLRPGGI